MISIVYCTRESNPKHSEHLRKCSGELKKVEIIEYINKGEGLTKFYQEALEEAKYDIILFCHDDILLETNQISKKITKLFNNNPEYGIIGVAGTKYMSETGRWWDDKKKMYGKVKHTHNGKSWLSSYSGDLGNELTETVIVDGLFFSVHRGRIKKGFNLDVKGFHFYDVDFCFRNYIEGVKIGVHTNVRVNHMSIGETNQEWEDNRLIFAEKYKEHLPVKIDKIFGPKDKIRVLIGCVNFQGLTGSELYVYELAKSLLKKGCEVSICSNLGSPLSNWANRLGIKVYTIDEPPGYKKGDGNWQINTPQGIEPSKPGLLYRIKDIEFDIMHLNHKPVTEHLLRLYPNTPAICSIHSEVISLEEPVLSSNIKKYIAIRQEIKDHIVNNHSVPSELVNVVYNPIDTTRFRKLNKPKNNKKRILFVGTIDYLRRNTIQDLINTTKDNNQELYIVGKNNDNYLDNMLIGNEHVKYFPPTNRVEDYIHMCDETAGVLLGRTTIEGWLCGKKGWIYDIDKEGNIISKKLHDIPSDVEKFSSDKVSEEITNIYKDILK